MAKIYSAPEHIKEPVIDFSNIKEWREREAKYIEEVKQFCLNHKAKKKETSEYIGEIISIPHADSYAQYMVLSMKPLELIHLKLGDAWDSQFADLLTVKKVKEMIDGSKKLAKIFGK